jgi:hypothetical protein
VFEGAVAFNQDLTPWNVDAVTNFNDMFNGATAFSQTLCWVTVEGNNMFAGTNGGSLDGTGTGACALTAAPSASFESSSEPSASECYDLYLKDSYGKESALSLSLSPIPFLFISFSYSHRPISFVLCFSFYFHRRWMERMYFIVLDQK